MDFIAGLPLVDEYNALWVIVDQLTKIAQYFPCSDMIKPEYLADSFILHILRPHGLPNSIILDQGSLFTSGFWTYIMKALGRTRNLSMVFHHEMDR
jgi:hypothetical protein